MHVIKISQIYRMKKSRWYLPSRWEIGHLVLVEENSYASKYSLFIYSKDVTAYPKYSLQLSDIAYELKVGLSSRQVGNPIIPLELEEKLDQERMICFTLRDVSGDRPKVVWIGFPSQTEFLEWRHLIAEKLEEIGLKSPFLGTCSGMYQTQDSTSSESTTSSLSEDANNCLDWERFWIQSYGS